MLNEAHDMSPQQVDDQERRENRWILPREPEQKDREWDEMYNFKKNPGAWEQYETNEWDYKEGKYKQDWRLKDASKRDEYKERKGRVDAYDGKKNWQETRLLPREYYARKKEIEKDGLPEMWMFPQVTDGLYSIQVMFPETFQHLTNEVGQARKWKEKARYHISMGYEPGWNEDGTPEDDKGFKEALYKFYDDYFHRIGEEEWDYAERGLGNKINVSSGATYELQDVDDEFIRRMNDLARWGTGKYWAHISLD